MSRVPRETRAGLLLARRLQPMFETLPADSWSFLNVSRTLSLVSRHARTLHRLAERDCNGVATDADNARAARLQDRITALVATLPAIPDGHPTPIGVQFGGDPRGAVVKLVLPPEWRHLHDCFAGEGVCV